MSITDEPATIYHLFMGEPIQVTKGQSVALQRLIKAYSTNANQIDLACLLRQALRHLSHLYNDPEKAVTVPKSDRLPDAQMLKEFGIYVSSDPDGHLKCHARIWKPAYDGLDDVELLDRDAFRMERRYHPEACTGDPFLLSFFEKAAYKSDGQKQAVRSTLMAPPGSTLVINLPTGSGKSLCYQVLTTLPFIGPSGDDRQSGLIIVVVPTIALALDQEKAIEPIIRHPTAYHSGEDQTNEDRRITIYKSILAKTQRIVFTSPESLVGSLKYPVYKAAEEGAIKAFVVDECHMVEQWGDEFRPEFQMISGLRRSLLDLCPDMRTLLFSATLSASAIETLHRFFGSPGKPFEVVSSVQLRQEPSYWTVRCETNAEKNRTIIEALRYMPRPLILYTYLVDDAHKWYDTLKKQGYSRVEVMTSETESTHRETIMADWRDDRIDIVIATSAFGLGVDKSDVRAVVHACVPETIDRLYQEVGRGGRDGCPSLSLVVYTRDQSRFCDYNIALQAHSKKIISSELGFQRWEAMFASKEHVGPERWRISVPVNVARLAGQDPSCDYTIKWNLRTINLMCRAGLISLHDQPPGKHTTELSEQAPRRIVVDVEDANHLSKDFWEKSVECLRDDIADNGRQRFTLMKDFLKGDKCAAAIFATAYTIENLSLGHAKLNVAVAECCSGCPSCRSHHKPPLIDAVPRALIPWDSMTAVGASLKRYLKTRQVLPLFFSSAMSEQTLKREHSKILEWLLSQQITCIIADEGFLEKLMQSDMILRQRLVSSPILSVTLDEFHSAIARRYRPRVPSAFIYQDFQVITSDDLERSIDRIDHPNLAHEPWVLIIPDKAVHPDKSHVMLRDYFPNSLDYKSLVRREML